MAGKAVDKDDSASDGSRTGDKDKDYLHFYLTSSHYDCTFSTSVSKEGSCAKIFKCHRFVLAAASTVFEKMLFGNFKEANQGRDDEIKIEVSPTAFDLAMRFIYGSQCDFQSCELAVEIYYFAHKWMIEGLLLAAGKFLMKYNSVDDALLVYEMCIDLNIAPTTQLSTRFCMIIQKKSNAVISSKQWLAAGRETILNIYSMPHLTASEAHLLKKLVAWGKARCSSDQSADLRAEIDPMLKNIRFRSMSCHEFLAISKESDVLTTEEILNILKSLILCDADLMPPAFSFNGCPRNLTNSKKVDWSSVGRLNDKPPDRNEPIILFFYVDTEGIFIGGIYMLIVDDAHSHGKDLSFTCTLLKFDTYKVMGMAQFDGVSNKVDKQRCILFDEPIALAMGCVYCIKIDYKSKQATCTSFLNGSNAQNYVRSEFCNVFFHAPLKVRDICGFQLLKR